MESWLCQEACMYYDGDGANNQLYDSLYMKYKWTLITEISRDLRMYMHRMIPEVESSETNWWIFFNLCQGDSIFHIQPENLIFTLFELNDLLMNGDSIVPPWLSIVLPLCTTKINSFFSRHVWRWQCLC